MELGLHSQTAVMAEFYHYIPILRAFEFGFPIPSSTFSIYLNYITMKKPQQSASAQTSHYIGRECQETQYIKGFFQRMLNSFHSGFKKHPHSEPAKNERCSLTITDTSDKKYPQHLQKPLSDGHFHGSFTVFTVKQMQ